MTLRVGVNAGVLHRGVSGSATAVELLIEAIESLDDVQCSVSAGGSGLRAWSMPRLIFEDFLVCPIRFRRCDVHVSACNTGLAWPRRAHVVVVHDTMVLDLPEQFDRMYRWYASWSFGLTLRGADAVVVPSSDTADRVRERWPTCPPILVLPWPARRHELAPPRRSFPSFTAITVGVTSAHKNQAAAVEAVAIARETSCADIRLEVIGPVGNAEEEVLRALHRFDPGSLWSVRRGPVSESELAQAYSQSWVLLQPSEYEGFGLPVAEAGTYALPVLHSGRGSLVEVNPHGDVGGTRPDMFAARMIDLLDLAQYEVASELSRSSAAALSHERFAGGIREVLTRVSSGGRRARSRV